MIKIIKSRKIWFTLSGIVLGITVLSLLIWGLKFGIDFTGGSLLEIEFNNSRPSNSEIADALISAEILNNVQVQPIQEKGIILRFETISEKTHQKIIEKINTKFDTKVVEQRFDSIGPSIGAELKQKTVLAIIIAIIAIIIYIAWAFRKVSKPVASWKYGLIAVIALFHDIIITLGIFSILGKFYNVEINAPFIAALLTILGYSVNDTIVVFDRTRENLARHLEGSFEEIVEKSVNQSITRSIYTAATTLLALFSILLFGGQTTRVFTLALIIGITIGTYSSIFLASPLLVQAQKLFKKY